MNKPPYAEAITIFIMGILCVLFSLHLSEAGGKAPQPAPSVTPSLLPIPHKGHIGFKCVSCTPKEEIKVKLAEVKANEVVQSNCFTDFMLNWGMIETKGKSPLAVIKHLQFAELTVPVHYYYDASKDKSIGYRQPPYPDIYFNQFYHKFYNTCDTAANGAHEWSHVLGYTHPFKPTPTRGRTVPYSISNAFDACCAGSNKYR